MLTPRFGEHYIYLACHGLCLENVTCPLIRATDSECAADNLIFALDDNHDVIKMMKVGMF